LTSSNLPEQVILDSTPILEKPEPVPTVPILKREKRPSYNRSTSQYPAEKTGNSHCNHSPYLSPPAQLSESQAPGILEQAWVLKMAGEIARRAQDEKTARESFWSGRIPDGREDSPPPAYEPKAT
jgi:mitochondrial distribution and morphology protein 34